MDFIIVNNENKIVSFESGEPCIYSDIDDVMVDYDKTDKAIISIDYAETAGGKQAVVLSHGDNVVGFFCYTPDEYDKDLHDKLIAAIEEYYN